MPNSADVRGRGALRWLVWSVPIEQTTQNGDAAPGRPVRTPFPAVVGPLFAVVPGVAYLSAAVDFAALPADVAVVGAAVAGEGAEGRLVNIEALSSTVTAIARLAGATALTGNSAST